MTRRLTLTHNLFLYGINKDHSLAPSYDWASRSTGNQGREQILQPWTNPSTLATGRYIVDFFLDVLRVNSTVSIFHHDFQELDAPMLALSTGRPCKSLRTKRSCSASTQERNSCGRQLCTSNIIMLTIFWYSSTLQQYHGRLLAESSESARARLNRKSSVVSCPPHHRRMSSTRLCAPDLF
jgi:hypothetical protein